MTKSTIQECTMKRVFLSCALLTGCLLSFDIFALERVVVSGEPVTLVTTTDGSTYTLPANYTVQSTNYVTLNGARRVCFATAQPNLTNVNVQAITVDVNGVATTWNCYLFNENNFQVVNP